MVKILVVEDDDLQRSILISILQELGHGYHILESSSAYDALRILKTNRIDLFFIDIQLERENGLKLARYLRKIPGYDLTWIVFITSHVKYMLEAFKEVHCYDYVLKPYEKSTIQSIAVRLLNDKFKAMNEAEKKRYIFVDIDGVMARIFIEDIIFIEVYGKVCMIHTTMGQYEVKNLPLIKLLSMVPANTIVQSHRSYAINMNYIRSINKNHDCWVISFVNYEKTALVGGKYKENIKEACKEYSVVGR